jgi:hypothetical protein
MTNQGSRALAWEVAQTVPCNNTALTALQFVLCGLSFHSEVRGDTPQNEGLNTADALGSQVHVYGRC